MILKAISYSLIFLTNVIANENGSEFPDGIKNQNNNSNDVKKDEGDIRRDGEDIKRNGEDKKKNEYDSHKDRGNGLVVEITLDSQSKVDATEHHSAQASSSQGSQIVPQTSSDGSVKINTNMNDSGNNTVIQRVTGQVQSMNKAKGQEISGQSSSSLELSGKFGVSVVVLDSKESNHNDSNGGDGNLRKEDYKGDHKGDSKQDSKGDSKQESKEYDKTKQNKQINDKFKKRNVILKNTVSGSVAYGQATSSAKTPQEKISSNSRSLSVSSLLFGKPTSKSITITSFEDSSNSKVQKSKDKIKNLTKLRDSFAILGNGISSNSDSGSSNSNDKPSNGNQDSSHPSSNPHNDHIAQQVQQLSVIAQTSASTSATKDGTTAYVDSQAQSGVKGGVNTKSQSQGQLRSIGSGTITKSGAAAIVVLTKANSESQLSRNGK